MVGIFYIKPGVKPLGNGHNLFILYPFLSWAGLMMLGYLLRQTVHRHGCIEKKQNIIVDGS